MEKKYCEVRRILFTFLSSHGLNAELGVVIRSYIALT